MFTFPENISIGSEGEIGMMTIKGAGGTTTIMDGMDINITITMMTTTNVPPCARSLEIPPSHEAKTRGWDTR
jgi:hypothetical protein